MKTNETSHWFFILIEIGGLLFCDSKFGLNSGAKLKILVPYPDIYFNEHRNESVSRNWK